MRALIIILLKSMEVNISNSVIKIPIPFSRNFKRKLITMLACVVAVVVAVSIDFNHSNDEIFEDYYKDPGMIIRGHDAEIGMLMKGHFYIQEREYHKAIVEFDKIVKHKGELFDQGQWYLCLCLIKTNSSEKDIHNLLCEIVKDSEQYSSLALEILSIKMDGADYHNKKHK